MEEFAIPANRSGLEGSMMMKPTFLGIALAALLGAPMALGNQPVPGGFVMPSPSEFFARNPDQRVPVTEFRTPDLDGDGIDDFVITRGRLPGETGPFTILSVTSHWVGETLLTVGSAIANDGFGDSALVFPDINGDGRSELLVTAPKSGNSVGRVDFFCGRTGSLLLRLQGTDVGATFGSAVAIGDFDGDGLQDVAIGEPGRENNTGRVVIFRHPSIAQAATTNATILATDADATLTATQQGEAFGYALASGVDFTGDGADEIVVGAPAFALPDGGVVAGRVVVYRGSTYTPLKTIRSTTARTAFGASVLVEDGSLGGPEPTLFIGAPGALIAAVDTNVTRGSVRRFSQTQLNAGVTLLLDTEAAATLTPSSPSFLHFGHDIQIGHDANGDGTPDLLIAASAVRAAFPQEIPPELVNEPGPFFAYDTYIQVHHGSTLASLYTFSEEFGSDREILVPFVAPAGGDAAPPPGVSLKGVGDIDGNAKVDEDDLSIVIAVFGELGIDAAFADTNSDGIIDAADITTVLQGYGDEGLALLSRECDRRAGDVDGPVVPIDYCECMHELGGAFGFGAEDIEDICEDDPGQIPGGGNPGGGGNPPPACEDMPRTTAEQCAQFADCLAARTFDGSISDAEDELADLQNQLDDLDAHVSTLQNVANLWANVVASDTSIMRWQVRRATEPQIQSLERRNRSTYAWTAAVAGAAWFTSGPLGGALV